MKTSLSKMASDLRFLVLRHFKVFFTDKLGMFFSLLSPLIILFLYVTFLRKVYYSSLVSMIPQLSAISGSVVNGFISGWLISSILGVTCVTLAFCVNTIMISDKINLNINDFYVAPVGKITIYFSYLIADFLITCAMIFVIAGLGFIYITIEGWYLSAGDVILALADILLTSLFGSLLASICEFRLSTNGSASGITTLVSSLYGFICGAYMPLSQFSYGIRNAVAFVPGTYGTILFRKCLLGGAIAQMGQAFPDSAISSIKDGFDYNIYFFGHLIEETGCFLILGGSCVLLAFIYAFILYASDLGFGRGKAYQKNKVSD